MSTPGADDPQGAHPSIKTVPDSLGLEDELAGRVFSFLQHSIRDVIFVLGLRAAEQYRFIYVDAAFQATAGLPREAVLGKLADEVIPPESIALGRGKHRRATETRESVTRRASVEPAWQACTPVRNFRCNKVKYISNN